MNKGDIFNQHRTGGDIMRVSKPLRRYNCTGGPLRPRIHELIVGILSGLEISHSFPHFLVNNRSNSKPSKPRSHPCQKMSRQGPSRHLPLTCPPVFSSSVPGGEAPQASVLSAFYETCLSKPHFPAVSTRVKDGPYVSTTYVGLMEDVLKLYLSLTSLSSPVPQSSNVCVLLPNSPTFSVISLATSSLHFALVPLYTTSTAEHR